MRSYYTIIYVQTNAAAQDRLAVGMVMIEPEAGVSHYDYSDRKLGIIGQLVAPGVATGIKWSFENLQKLFLGLRHPSGASRLSKSYLQRLAATQKNVVLFEDPIGIDLPCSEQAFRLLYEELIHNVPINLAKL